MLQTENLESGYGPMQVLWGTTLSVKRGSITALLGPNGAGKTTTLRSILGTIRPTGGAILYEGEDITRLPAHQRVQKKIALVPEGKHLFVNMTTRENLVMGAYTKEAAMHADESLESVFALFPLLKERMGQHAGTLSGGEQQMLTIGRALMARPHLVMLDEPSQGLAPKLVGEVFKAVELLRQSGMTILLVEQNVEYSLSIADYAYIMHEGVISIEGSADEVAASPQVREAYLGI